jgi:hypothetical protein
MSANLDFEILPFPPTDEFEASDREDEFEIVRRWPVRGARVHAAARSWPGPRIRDHRWVGNLDIWRAARAPWRPARYFPAPDYAPTINVPAPYTNDGAGPDSDRVRWLQDALNHLLNLNLPVDGIVRPALRDAVRAFQQGAGLRVTGRVGPATERALTAAISAASPGAPAGEAEGYYEGENEGYYEREDESEAPPHPAAAAFRFVKDFAGPAAECSAALRRAGKTKVQALTIINAQIAVAIRLLRKAAADLDRGKRSAATSKLFLDIFRVRPEFVPSWFKPTPTIHDRGDVVATRCARVADLLASGSIRFFCAVTATNCPDCGNDNSPDTFACSSWGQHLVICLGNGFWDDMKNGRTNSILSTLMHEPFHVYFGRYVTEHRTTAGKFGGIHCILRFVFETNGMATEQRNLDACAGTPVRR